MYNSKSPLSLNVAHFSGNRGHAQYLGNWYCPIKMSDITVDQWRDQLKMKYRTKKDAKMQQLQQQQLLQQQQQQEQQQQQRQQQKQQSTD